MSRKKALGKKIAHTLMAMSIVYSSGINIVVHQVYAGEKTENITGSSASFTETGANGNNYAMSGGVTDGEDASITGKITDSNVAANPIVITANGGHGGIDNGNSPTVMQGAIGGDAIAKVTVDESLSSITTGNITVNATGGSNGSAYQGVAGDAGAAAAYGLEVKHDLTITAADITVSAQRKYNDNSFGSKVDIEAAKHNDVTATGLRVDDGTVNFTGGGIKVLASNEAPYTTIDELAAEKRKGSDGGDAKAYGIRVNGGEVTAKLTGNIVVDKINAGSGANIYTGLNNGTLGFSGTSADRTVTGGKLQLTGSNAFRFTTDLANNKADSMTFDTIENNSFKQYIQIGYEEAFKDALSKEDIVTINGSVTVLTVTNLNGQNLNNFTGQASRLDSPLERFKVTPTVEIVNDKVNITEIALAKENSPSETAMVASDAQMAMGSMWRIEGNNLMKRMGELRSDKEAAKGGVWARYYRGELSADSAYDREFSQDYTAFQGGIDKVQDYKGGKLYTGIAVNRIDSNAGYTAGSGDLSSTGVGLYASWLGSKGHYVDVIARGSKLSNDFKLVDLSGNSAKADYDTWAYGISAEYGYRQNLNAGWFVEPQAELSLGRIGSADYTTSNGVTIKQDSVNSAVVRLGFLGGKEFTIGGRTSNAYVKASALHDFGGNGGATGYYENSSLALQTGDLTGTWYEIGLGANLGIAKNSNLYFDALKTFNGNLRTDWQFNAGLRFSF